MKIFLFGPSSSLGQAYKKAAKRRNHTVYSIHNRLESSQVMDDSESVSIDFSDPSAIQKLIFSEWPDVIVNGLKSMNTADEKEMVAINVTLPTYLAQISHHLSARYIQLSSTQIFDGSNDSPYRSTDKPNPTDFIGQTLLLGEKAVLNHNTQDPLILRIPEMLGNSMGKHTENHTYNERLLRIAHSSERIKVQKQRYIQPTSANNVADLLLELSERRDLHGIFHWAGREVIDEYSFAKMILSNAKIRNPEDRIEVLSDEKRNFSIELSPLKEKVKTKALSIPELFDDLNYIEPIYID
mgnify:CR=1 FL=1